MAEMDRNKRRPPTGPIAPTEDEEARRRRLKERWSTQQEDTPTRQIDTKPLVSAAFEEDEVAEELGFDRPLLVAGAQPGVSPLSFEPVEQEGRSRRNSDSVLVDMDFEEDSQEHTPTSLWRDKPAAPAPAAPENRPTSPSRLRPATGPHRPSGLTPGATAELLPAKPSGSARRRHRPARSTAQLPRQRSSADGRGPGSRVITYVLIGAALGLGLGLFLGLRRGPTAKPEGTSRALSAASQRAIARVASRRELSATDRAGLVAVRREMDAGRWFAASQAFVRLPERLRKEVAVGYWQGRMLAAQGRHQAAAKLLRQLLIRAPAASWRVELGVELSEVLLAAGRRAEALEAVRKARLELDADASEELASRIVRQLRRCTER